MTAQAPIDDFQPPWASYAEFFLHRADDDGPFLTELNHETGTREQWSVAQWKARVASTAQWLGNNGVHEGDAVATLAGNTADALSVAYAAWAIGACCVPLNPSDPLERQAYIVEDAKASLLVYSETHSVAAAFIAERTPVVIRTAADLPRQGSNTALNEQLAGASGGLDVAALRVYTSGTTGQPKGVVLSTRNLLTDCDAVRLAFDWPAGTRILTVLPIHHVNGLILSSLLPWYAGFSTVLCDRFRTENFWSDVVDEGATVCSMVPSLLEFLLATPGEAPHHFHEVLCGAGPLLTQTALDFEDRFGIPIRHLYGLSETTAVVTVTPRLDADERRRWHRTYGVPSIGPAVPHVEVSVQDIHGRPAGMGERGELVIRGGVVMQGYAGLADETDRALGDGWFHSGDEGFWIQETDAEKHFFVSGRMKELIIRGGSNISPLEVDSVLRSHPAVDFALAIPFENRFYGEEIAAYVVTNTPVSEEDLLAHCARYLDYARQPKVIIQGDEVPFTATGKAKRIELRDRLAPTLAQYRDRQFRRSTAAKSTEVSRGFPAVAKTPEASDPNRSEA